MTAKEMLRAVARRAGYDILRTSTIQGWGGEIASRHDPWQAVGDLMRDRPNPVIFDVGANAGQTVTHCRNLLPTARVYSFEPSPTTYHALQAAVAHLQGVETFNVAMGERPGSMTLFESSQSTGTSVLRPAPRRGMEHIVRETVVEVRTVDQFREEHSIDRIDVLKTDTQGFDLAVLQGTRNSFAANVVDVILTEIIFSHMYEDAPRFDKLLEYALDNGFRVVGIYPGDYTSRPDGLIEWADVLLLHERLY